jgi:hypothetical protein
LKKKKNLGILDFAKIENLSKGNWKINNIYLEIIKREKKKIMKTWEKPIL